MFIQHNYMRIYRKKSGLRQSDIVSLLKLSGRGSVGLWERGVRKSPLDIPIAYHLLFGVPIESIFEHQTRRIRGTLSARIEKRIEDLRARPSTPQIAKRIGFLEGSLNRLTAEEV